MGFLLKAWNIPACLYEPLIYSSQSYNSVASLNGPLATKVELLKVAILIAEIAVGRWESWDRIEPPPAPLLDRLGIDSYGQVIKETQRDYKDLIRFRENIFQGEETKAPEISKKPTRTIFYCNLAAEAFDFPGEIISRSGIALEKCELDEIGTDDPVIVNCIGVPAHRLVASLKTPESNPNMLILTVSSQTENFSRFGRVLSLPASYDSLRTACFELLK
jgi:hypothetical protein